MSKSSKNNGTYVVCVHAVRARLCVWITLTNITLDLLLMAWNFKDISRFV